MNVEPIAASDIVLPIAIPKESSIAFVFESVHVWNGSKRGFGGLLAIVSQELADGVIVFKQDILSNFR